MYPLANIPLVEFAVPPKDCFACVKSPKSSELPLDEIVINSIAFV